MKKILSMLLLSMMLFATACGEGAKEPENPDGTGEEPLKAILIVNGNLGDLGFFDSANQGMERLKKELGVETKVIETGADESKWEPALADAAEEDADIIIAVSPSMVEPMEKIAPDYPDKRFFLIDNSVDYTTYVPEIYNDGGVIPKERNSSFCFFVTSPMTFPT